MMELLLVVLSGFSIGLIGSFHCIGMCGPLALSLPVYHLGDGQKTMAIALYNIGRTTTYALIGLLIGVLGQGFSIFNMQQILSITAGVLMLLVLFGSTFRPIPFKPWNTLAAFVQKQLHYYLTAKQQVASFFGIGILNGFLPCGLVYVALASSLTAGTILKSSLVMAGFGLGTIPLMALTMFFGKFIPPAVRIKFNQFVPYFIFMVAVLLVLRGLNLGIPFVSPAYHPHEPNLICH